MLYPGRVGFADGRCPTSVLLALPLTAFLFSAESTGLDILNATNFSWATALFVLIGLAWRAPVFMEGDQLKENENST